MRQNWRPLLSCDKPAPKFPVIATAIGVAGCLGESLLDKYFAPGRVLQIALALVQTVPLGLLVRYLVNSSRKTADQINLRDGGVR
ncbi:MAG: hypothetical protein ACJ8M1_13145 [Chthoniobacterales bacterium]